MTIHFSEIEIVPVKPNNGLVGFASLILNNSLFLGSIGIYTRLDGGYRLTYPTKKVSNSNISIFHPITKQMGQEIEKVVCKKFEEVTKQYDRHDSSRAL